jgi:hypothetical protein
MRGEIQILLMGMVMMLLFWFCMDNFERRQEVESLHAKVAYLQKVFETEQRPLVVASGKYPYIGVSKKQLVIADDTTEEPERKKGKGKIKGTGKLANTGRD